MAGYGIVLLRAASTSVAPVTVSAEATEGAKSERSADLFGGAAALAHTKPLAPSRCHNKQFGCPGATSLPVSHNTPSEFPLASRYP